MDFRAFILGVVIALALIYLLLAVVIQRLDREPGFRSLQVGALAGAVCIFLLSLQGMVSPVLSVVMANALGVLSLLMLWQGLYQWHFLRAPHRIWWSLPVLMLLLGYWFTQVQPDIVVRTVVVNLLMLVPMVGLASLLWWEAPRASSKALHRATALVGFVMAALTAGRIIVAIGLGLPAHSLFDPGWPHITLFLGQVVGLLTLVMLIVALLVTHVVHNLRNAAGIDPLTGLLNRLGFRTRVQLLLQSDRPACRHCALMMFDLDHFKRINDHHGHDVGDQVLRRLALDMQAAAGPEDLPVRLGGEEFALLTFSEDPLAQAEAIRERFASSRAGLPDCTVSIGLVPAIRLDEHQLRAAFSRADRALYEAKRLGRNRTERAAPAAAEHVYKRAAAGD
ncbi:diguanylate cyclase [Thioalkalivibrio sp. ALJT]|uniref:GGDEF domain-containing protein n=1 Tax=Thioalkalivibrio sp. ALJT TaxID=1158146 RepID=UPI0003757116|nr:GGDEF domain-containing protein [Thioalkalivibrio sp. ALJT]